MSFKLSKEAKAAVIVLIGLLFVFFGVRFLKSGAFLDFDNAYYAKFPYSGGLAISAPVSLNGIQVGLVKDISFAGKGEVVVKFTVTEDLPLSKNTLAGLEDSGIMGGKFINLTPDWDPHFPLSKGDTLKSKLSPSIRDLLNNKVTPMVDNASEMIASIKTTFASVNKIIDTQGQNKLNVILDNFYKTSLGLSRAVIGLNKLISDNQAQLKAVIQNTAAASDNLKILSDSLKNVRLGHTMIHLNRISRNLDSIATRLNSGQGTLSKMIYSDTLYRRLESASKEAEELLRDIKLNPKRYFSILRRKQIPYNQEPK